MERGRTFASIANPEAGTYPVTSDPAEVEAVLVAAERTWREFPYYERRFGERGRRFCGSDTGWLVTLCSLPRAEGLRQVEWLAGVLASRGMPSLLLERHLGNLHDALVDAIPARKRRYALLRVAGERLRDARDRRIAAADQEAIASRFEERVSGVRGRLAGFGELLVCAVADERRGIENAVATVEPWATNGEEFPRRWIDAVRAAISEARASSVPRASRRAAP